MEAYDDASAYFFNQTVLLLEYFLVFVAAKGELLKRFDQELCYHKLLFLSGECSFSNVGT